MKLAPGLKLYVVGESSGIPKKWGMWYWRAFVAAHTPEEAVAMVDKTFSGVAEVEVDEPCVLTVEESHPPD